MLRTNSRGVSSDSIPAHLVGRVLILHLWEWNSALRRDQALEPYLSVCRRMVCMPVHVVSTYKLHLERIWYSTIVPLTYLLGSSSWMKQNVTWKWILNLMWIWSNSWRFPDANHAIWTFVLTLLSSQFNYKYHFVLEHPFTAYCSILQAWSTWKYCWRSCKVIIIV